MTTQAKRLAEILRRKQERAQENYGYVILDTATAKMVADALDPDIHPADADSRIDAVRRYCEAKLDNTNPTPFNSPENAVINMASAILALLDMPAPREAEQERAG